MSMIEPETVPTPPTSQLPDGSVEPEQVAPPTPPTPTPTGLNTVSYSVKMPDGSITDIPVDANLPPEKLGPVLEGAIRARMRIKSNPIVQRQSSYDGAQPAPPFSSLLPSTVGDAASKFLHGVISPLRGAASDFSTGAKMVNEHPLDSLNLLPEALMAPLRAAYDASIKLNPGSIAGDMMAGKTKTAADLAPYISSIPGVGGMADSIGAAASDPAQGVAGGVGQATGATLLNYLASKGAGGALNRARAYMAGPPAAPVLNGLTGDMFPTKQPPTPADVPFTGPLAPNTPPTVVQPGTPAFFRSAADTMRATQGEHITTATPSFGPQSPPLDLTRTTTTTSTPSTPSPTDNLITKLGAKEVPPMSVAEHLPTDSDGGAFIIDNNGKLLTLGKNPINGISNAHIDAHPVLDPALEGKEDVPASRINKAYKETGMIRVMMHDAANSTNPDGEIALAINHTPSQAAMRTIGQLRVNNPGADVSWEIGKSQGSGDWQALYQELGKKSAKLGAPGAAAAMPSKTTSTTSTVVAPGAARVSSVNLQETPPAGRGQVPFAQANQNLATSLAGERGTPASPATLDFGNPNFDPASAAEQLKNQLASGRAGKPGSGARVGPSTIREAANSPTPPSPSTPLAPDPNNLKLRVPVRTPGGTMMPLYLEIPKSGAAAHALSVLSTTIRGSAAETMWLNRVLKYAVPDPDQKSKP